MSKPTSGKGPPPHPNQPPWRPQLYGPLPLSPHLKGKPDTLVPILDPLTPQEIFHNFTCSLHTRICRLNEALHNYRRLPESQAARDSYLAARTALELVLDEAEKNCGITGACVNVDERDGYVRGFSVEGSLASGSDDDENVRSITSHLSSSSDVGIPPSTWSSSSSSSSSSSWLEFTASP
ncbi:hypothetical protein BH23VER1_BH23VER1_36400 [soil metagenome]